MRRGWPVLASIGVNGALVALLLNLPQKAPSPGSNARAIIPVTLVQQPPAPPPEPAPEPEDEPEPEPEPPPQAKPTPAPPARVGTPSNDDSASIQSPIIAGPGEAIDADRMAGDETDIPELDLPIFAGRQERAAGALRAFRCNRLGAERPVWCDEDAPDVIEAAERPGFADVPTLAPMEWAAFELPEAEEWCPQSDGVIRDAIVETRNPNLQGAAAAVGQLAVSEAATCGD